MADDKAKLLRSLAIDRGDGSGSGAQPARRRRWPAWVAASVTIVVLLAACVLFLPELRHSQPAAEQAAAPPAPPPTAALAEPRRSGGLAASGYVVARRKATVAAEITGKVVEVLVEEGMVVEAGQVVARLDSVLAATDLALAQSRAAASQAAVEAIAAELRDAERIFGRTQSLSQKNFATEADLTKAEARLGVLRAQLSQSHAQRETTRLDARRQAE